MLLNKGYARLHGLAAASLRQQSAAFSANWAFTAAQQGGCSAAARSHCVAASQRSAAERGPAFLLAKISRANSPPCKLLLQLSTDGALRAWSSGWGSAVLDRSAVQFKTR